MSFRTTRFRGRKVTRRGRKSGVPKFGEPQENLLKRKGPREQGISSPQQFCGIFLEDGVPLGGEEPQPASPAVG